MATENDDHWNHNDTQLLLQLYAENKEKFRNNKIKKKDLWKEIGSQVGKLDVLCDRKFRNLKGTYIKLLRKNKRKTGTAPIKWPYFSLMQDILEGDMDINPVNYLKPITTIPSWNLTRNEELFLLVSSRPDKKTSMLAPSSTEETVRASTPACSTDNEGDTTPKTKRRKFDRYWQLAEEIKQSQRSLELKIDKMNEILMKSNEIQKTRNKLLQQYLEQQKE